MSHVRSIVGLGLVLATGLAGCAVHSPPTHYYVLESRDTPQAETTGAATPGGITLGVVSFDVDPPYDQDRIVYRVGEASAEVGFYAYHRWAAPLARMVPRVVAAGLEGLDEVRSIEPAIAGREYDGLVRGRILRLDEADTPEGATAHAHLFLILTVGDEEIWSGATRGEASIATRDVGAVVERMRAALSDAVAGARPGVRRALEQISR